MLSESVGDLKLQFEQSNPDKVNAAYVLSILRQRGLTLSCAESLTGGLLADAFVQVPGASKVFRGAAVTYTDEVKTKVLGVDPNLLEEKTAYDPEVAGEMALGACEMFGSDLALSTTGVAGPGPDQGFPAGSGYIGLADMATEGLWEIELQLEGDRAKIRQGFVDAAILMILTHLDSEPGQGDGDGTLDIG